MDEPKLNDDVIDVESTIVNESKPEPAPARKREFRKMLAAGAAIGVVCAVLGGWFYRNALESYLPTDQMQALSTRVDGLDVASKDAAKRVDAVIALSDELKAKLGAAQAQADKSAKASTESSSVAQATAATVAELKQALDDEKASLESLQSKLTSSTGTSSGTDPAFAMRLEALEKEVAALKAAPAPVASALPDAGLLKQTVEALKAKVAAGQGFAAEAAALEKLLPAAEGLDILKVEAAAGLPNAEALSQSLNSASQALPKSVSPQASSGGWLDSVGGWFSNLVTIKPLAADEAGTLAAKAAAFLAAGDLQQATDVLASSTAPLPASLQAWHEAALRRLKLEKAVAQVSAAAARQLAAKG